jgi:transposase
MSERQTTKACCKCFKIKENVGGSDTYRCINPTCPAKAPKKKWDRDMNGAFNICLRNAEACGLNVVM